MSPQHAEIHGALSATSVFKVHESGGDESVTVPAGTQAEVNADLAGGTLTAHDASLHVSRAASADETADQHVDGDLATSATISIDGKEVLVGAGTRLDASGVVENGRYMIQELHLGRAGASGDTVQPESAGTAGQSATVTTGEASALHGTVPAAVSFAVYGSVSGSVHDQVGTSLMVRLPAGARADVHAAPVSGTLTASEASFHSASAAAPGPEARATLHGSLTGSLTILVAGTPAVLPAGARLHASGTLANGTFVAQEVQVTGTAPAPADRVEVSGRAPRTASPAGERVDLHGAVGSAVALSVYGGSGSATSIQLPAAAQANVNAQTVSGTLTAHQATFHVARTATASEGAEQTVKGRLTNAVSVKVGTTTVLLPVGARVTANGTLVNGVYVLHELAVNGERAASPASAGASATGATSASDHTSAGGGVVLNGAAHSNAPKIQHVSTTPSSPSSNASRPAAPGATTSGSGSASPSAGASVSNTATVTGTAATAPSSTVHGAATQAATAAATTTSAGTTTSGSSSASPSAGASVSNTATVTGTAATAPSSTVHGAATQAATGTATTTSAGATTSGSGSARPSAGTSVSNTATVTGTAAASSTASAAPSAGAHLTAAPSGQQAAAYSAGAVLPKTGQSPAELVLGVLLMAAGLAVRPWAHRPSDR